MRVVGVGGCTEGRKGVEKGSEEVGWEGGGRVRVEVDPNKGGRVAT